MSLPCAEPAIQLLVLERVDPASNCQRYYVLSVSPTLFGDMALTREWGRIGCAGRSQSSLHPDPQSAREALAVWLRRKRRRNYRPVFVVTEENSARQAMS